MTESALPSLADPSTRMGRGARPDSSALHTLRRVLNLDAAGMIAVGIGYLAAASPLSDWFGPSITLVRIVGAAMLVAAIGIGAVARRAVLTVGAVGGVIGIGAGWIVLSLVALGAGWLNLTIAGLVWTWLQIMPVAVFSTWQALALRAHLHAAGPRPSVMRVR